MFTKLQQLDEKVLKNISRLHRPSLNLVMKTASRSANVGIIWWLICLPFVLRPEWRATGINFVIALAFSHVMGEGLIKHTVKRVRPCHDMDDEDKLMNNPRTFYSFPSGHTASSFAVTAVIISSHCPAYVWIPILLVSMTIGFSRVYLRVHYLTDVVVGMLLGTVCGIASVLLFHAIVPQDIFFRLQG